MLFSLVVIVFILVGCEENDEPEAPAVDTEVVEVEFFDGKDKPTTEDKVIILE